jgi:hypothetical protein
MSHQPCAQRVQPTGRHTKTSSRGLCPHLTSDRPTIGTYGLRRRYGRVPVASHGNACARSPATSERAERWLARHTEHGTPEFSRFALVSASGLCHGAVKSRAVPWPRPLDGRRFSGSSWGEARQGHALRVWQHGGEFAERDVETAFLEPAEEEDARPQWCGRWTGGYGIRTPGLSRPVLTSAFQ